MTINILTETRPDLPFHYRKLAERVILCALDAEDFPYETEVNLTLTDDARIREINRDMRGIDASTDVLSFPMVDYDAPADYSLLEKNAEAYANPDTGEIMLGDIVISVDHLKLQAEEYGHSEKREYAFLITHSMLHLIGYDHMEDAERTLMEERQRVILDQLGISRTRKAESL